MIRYRVVHTTQYQYSLPVSLGHNEAHLLPRSSARQYCQNSRLLIQPSPTVCYEREDFFGNRVTHFVVQEPHTTLAVTASSEVHLIPTPLPNSRASLPWEEAREQLCTDNSAEVLDARQFVLDSPLVHVAPELAAYAAPSFSPGHPLLEAVEDLMRRIHREFTYDPHFTTVATPLSEVFQHRRGVCQDFAHLVLGCLRSLGLAARYVSGYLATSPRSGQPSTGEDTASHAWLAVYSPAQGWMDCDPTNNQLPTDRHITVAWGRDYSDVTPLKGVIFGGGQHTLRVAVEVIKV
jgi:transglutaminase-like putative cysteine protease